MLVLPHRMFYQSQGEKKSRVGRPIKVHEQLRGETSEEYVVRIARLQKRPLPPFAPTTLPRSLPSIDEAPRKSRPRISSGEHLRRPRQGKLSLRDWSEVLGSAALVGFPQDVIARATQRCVDLFGEGMAMKTMAEASFLAMNAERDTIYQPEEITSLSSSSEEDSGGEELPETNIRLLSSRAASQAGAYLCPVDRCPRQAQGFDYEFNLKRHLQKAHKMTADKADAMLDSDGDMDGAVHVDGFLKPIRPRRRAKKMTKSGANSSADVKRTQSRKASSKGSDDECTRVIDDSSSSSE